MIHPQIQIFQKSTPAWSAADSLEDIPVELFLPITQELANHLPTQAFPLEQEVGHTHRSVWNKVSLYQILNAFFWFPRDTGKSRERETKKERGKMRVGEDTFQICDYPVALLTQPNVCRMKDRMSGSQERATTLYGVDHKWLKGIL